MPDIAKSQKDALRTKMRKRMQPFSGGEIILAEKSAAACNFVINMAEFARARLILAYMPLKNEIDTAHIISEAQSKGKRVAFPRCEYENILSLHVPKNANAFEAGRFGIRQPIVAQSEQVNAQDIDLLIVPGVAFDNQCNRLGHGAGYFDRLLKATRGIKIGLCFDFQLVDTIPTDEHDVSMDFVVTNHGIIVNNCIHPCNNTVNDDKIDWM